MKFKEELPVWEAEGIKPPKSKIEDGWKAGDKPPAEWFNWLHTRTYKSLRELREVYGSFDDEFQESHDKLGKEIDNLKLSGVKERKKLVDLLNSKELEGSEDKTIRENIELIETTETKGYSVGDQLAKSKVKAEHLVGLEEFNQGLGEPEWDFSRPSDTTPLSDKSAVGVNATYERIRNKDGFIVGVKWEVEAYKKDLTTGKTIWSKLIRKETLDHPTGGGHAQSRVYVSQRYSYEVDKHENIHVFCLVGIDWDLLPTSGFKYTVCTLDPEGNYISGPINDDWTSRGDPAPNGYGTAVTRDGSLHVSLWRRMEEKESVIVRKVTGKPPRREDVGELVYGSIGDVAVDQKGNVCVLMFHNYGIRLVKLKEDNSLAFDVSVGDIDRVSVLQNGNIILVGRDYIECRNSDGFLIWGSQLGVEPMPLGNDPVTESDNGKVFVAAGGKLFEVFERQGVVSEGYSQIPLGSSTSVWIVGDDLLIDTHIDEQGRAALYSSLTSKLPMRVQKKSHNLALSDAYATIGEVKNINGDTLAEIPDRVGGLKLKPEVVFRNERKGVKYRHIYPGDKPVIYVADGGTDVAGYDETGKKVNQFVNILTKFTSIAADDDFYYTGSEDRRIRKIRKSNDKAEWNSRRHVSSAMAADFKGNIYSAGDDNKIFKLDEGGYTTWEKNIGVRANYMHYFNGYILASYKGGTKIYSENGDFVSELQLELNAVRPTFHEGEVYLFGKDGVAALDKDMKVEWVSKTGVASLGYAFSKNNIYVHSSSYVAKLSKNGEKKWSSSYLKDGDITILVIGSKFVAAKGPEKTCLLSHEDGKLIDSLDVADKAPLTLSEKIEGDGYSLVTDKQVTAVNPDNETVFNQAIKDVQPTAADIFEDGVVVSGLDGVVRRLNTSDKVVWERVDQVDTTVEITSVGSNIYLGGLQGEIVVLDSQGEDLKATNINMPVRELIPGESMMFVKSVEHLLGFTQDLEEVYRVKVNKDTSVFVDGDTVYTVEMDGGLRTISPGGRVNIIDKDKVWDIAKAADTIFYLSENGVKRVRKGKGYWLGNKANGYYILADDNVVVIDAKEKGYRFLNKEPQFTIIK